MFAKKPKQPTSGKRQERLHINRLPSQVTGVPEELFHQFSVEITITGMNSVTRRLRVINDDGSPGRIIPYEEAMKLSRAAGFVQAHSKQESRSELTEMTRSLFWNSKADVKKVKDPKIFAKQITGYEENLQKVEQTLSRAGEGVEDQEAKGFMTTMLQRARLALNALIANRIKGGTIPESKIFMDNGFPSSLKSKLLSGSFEVAPQGQFWTSLYGKEMHRFCNLTVEELKSGMVNDPVFYPSGKGKDISTVIQDKNLAQLCGFPTWESTPEKMKERILSYQFPIVLPIRTVEFFRRYATTKAQIPSKNVIEAAWPTMDQVYNAILIKEYHQAPREMNKLKEFWASVAGQQLFDPTLVSKDYRTQAINAMDENTTEEKLTVRNYETDIGNTIINGFPLKFATMTEGFYESFDGTKIKLEKGFDKYKPVEIVGPRKRIKKKDQVRKQTMRKNKLSPKSKKLFKALKKKGFPSELLMEIEEYLQSFVHLGMQEMAAHIVYVTSEISVPKARKIILDEEEEDQEPSDTDEGDDSEIGSADESAEDEDDDGEGLPPIIEA